MMQLTYRFRLRDKHISELNRQARAVNYVWNYANETQQKAVQSERKWLTAVDLQKLTSGASALLNIHSQTICMVCQQYDRSRGAKRRPWLRWRGLRSLGWVPFNGQALRFNGKTFRFLGAHYEPMHLREIPSGAKISSGSFNQDARGRWYINAIVDVATADRAPLTRVGIDLGLKDLATLSDGRKIAAPRFYRKSEVSLATAQRARKTKRARAIHAKAANRRKDFLHKLSAQLSKEHGLIVVGDVSPSKLAQTRMAKSINDAGWSDLKRMFSYKTHLRGGACIEVSEHLTTQMCSACGSLPEGRPKGIAHLRIREWTCGDCGAIHDRDVNAAQNILARGLASLAEGASTEEQPTTPEARKAFKENVSGGRK
jgi:putative transposase